MSRKLWNWQHPNWPNFKYDLDRLHGPLYEYAKSASVYPNTLNQYSEETRIEIMLDIIIAEAQHTSSIEGEIISPTEIRSSVKKHLNLPSAHYQVQDKRAEGIGSLMVLARETFQQPLTEDMLLQWHELLMLGANPYHSYEWGMWRTGDEPMQIVSGHLNKERIHFEAPPSDLVSQEMTNFISWYNHPDNQKLPGPIRAGIAHLYFESIHPFQDGNGRIGRALSEKILSQDLGYPILFSISSSIEKNKANYYQELSRASQYILDITPWLEYFVKLLFEAQKDAGEIIGFTLKKANFWLMYAGKLNARQEKVLQRMFKEGQKGFDGGIQAKKYMTLTGVSKATATRDLTELHKLGCLKKLPGSGRSTRYEIALLK